MLDLCRYCKTVLQNVSFCLCAWDQQNRRWSSSRMLSCWQYSVLCMLCIFDWELIKQRAFNQRFPFPALNAYWSGGSSTYFSALSEWTRTAATLTPVDRIATVLPWNIPIRFYWALLWGGYGSTSPLRLKSHPTPCCRLAFVVLMIFSLLTQPRMLWGTAVHS